MSSDAQNARDNLRRMINEHGVDMATVSRAIGKNHAYIQQYLTRGIPVELSYSTALALSRFFNCPLALFGIQPPSTKASNDKGKKQHPVQTVRRMLGLPIKEFSYALNTPTQTIEDIEKFITPLSETLLLRICQTFNINPDDLRDFVPQFTDAERSLIYRLRRMTPEQQKTLHSLLENID